MLFKLTGIIEKISYFTVSRWSVSLLGAISDLNNAQTEIQLIFPHIERSLEDIYNRTTKNILLSGSILLFFVPVCAAASIIILRGITKDMR